MRRTKTIFRAAILFLLALAVTAFYCDHIVSESAKGKLYNTTSAVPYHKVGLLLGTSKYLNHGRINLYYRYRIDAAIALLKAGKIKYIIISGDNSTKNYNEPETMRADLIKAGIDSNVIYLDYAGFRTFDSVVRLKEIFGQDAVTFISQPFHNERAIYLADRLGIESSGFNSRDVKHNAGIKVRIREKFARLKLFFDFLVGTKPKFLGEKIVIPR